MLIIFSLIDQIENWKAEVILPETNMTIVAFSLLAITFLVVGVNLTIRLK